MTQGTEISVAASTRPSWPSTLYELTLAVASATSNEDIYDAALAALEDSLGVRRASLLLFDVDGVMRFRAWRQLSDEYRAAVDGHSPWKPDTRDAAPVLVEDVLSDPSLVELLPVFEREGIRALAFIPLTLGQRLLGKFMLYYAEPHTFDEREIVTAQAIAAHVTFAVDQMRHRDIELRYRSLADALPAIVVTTDAHGNLEEVDQTYRDFTRLTSKQLRATPTSELVHADDVETVRAAWTEALATGDPFQFEARLRRHDGVYCWHLLDAQPIRGADGTVQRWVMVGVDIDARRRAQARDAYLAETTAHLITPIDSTGLLTQVARLAVPALADVCSIGVFDNSIHTVRVETAVLDEAMTPHVAAIHLRQWLSEPASSRTIGEVVSTGGSVCVPDTSPEWIRACAITEEQIEAAARIQPGSLACFPLIARGKPFGMISLATTGSRTRYDEGDFALFREVASRLSIALENRHLYDEASRAADDLRQANQVKDDFLGLVSHELKTPITMILGNAEVLHRQLSQLSAPDRDMAIEDIHREAGRLHRIVDNLLVLARLDRGAAIDLEPILIDGIVERVIRDHARVSPQRLVTSRVLTEPRVVLGSEQYVEQILVNLVSNAEKYSAGNEPIEVVVDTNNEELIVRVFDSGPGLSEDEAESLFAAFYRSDKTAHLAQGVGIGLAVCKRLVEAQGGNIWARNRATGGAEFGFALPLYVEDAAD